MNETDEAHLRMLADIKRTNPPNLMDTLGMIARAIIELRADVARQASQYPPI